MSARMSRIFLASAAGGLVILLAETASGGVNRWTSNGPPAQGVNSLAIDPATPTTIYAAAGRAGLFRSTDGGSNWSAMPIDARINLAVATVAVDPMTPTTVWAGSINDGGSDGTAPRGGAALYKSTDGGISWSASDSGLPQGTFVAPLAIAPSQPTTIYLRAGVRLFKSVDGGGTWTPLSLQVQNISGLAADPLNAFTVFATAYGGRGPNGGVFKSADGGVTWGDTRAPLGRAWSVAVDPVNPANVYARGDFGGFVKSTDGGATWTHLASPLTLSGAALAIDPRNPQVLYAASRTDGVFRSTDAGNTWAPFNTGLTNLAVASLAIDPSGTMLHAGTVGGGVFDYQIADGPLTLASGRFRVSLIARDQRTGRFASGKAMPRSDLFGYFSLPAFTGDPNNPEVFVKLLDGTEVNGKYWFFYGGLTDLEYTLTVTDTLSGNTKTYRKDPGSACGGFDTAAF